jgi:hypothetical protein
LIKLYNLYSLLKICINWIRNFLPRRSLALTTAELSHFCLYVSSPFSHSISSSIQINNNEKIIKKKSYNDNIFFMFTSSGCFFKSQLLRYGKKTESKSFHCCYYCWKRPTYERRLCSMSIKSWAQITPWTKRGAY